MSSPILGSQPDPRGYYSPMAAPSPAADWLKVVGAIAGLVFWGLVLYLVVGACNAVSSEDTVPAASAPPTSKAPPDHQTMPGDGVYSMGGVDGKDWGIWRSTGGGGGGCVWSVRLTNPHTGAAVLDEGSAGQVSIQPPDWGDVSPITGEIDGGRIVFLTNGCGAWTVRSQS